MTEDQLRDELDMLLDEMSDEAIIELHNSIADDYSAYDKIYPMEEFDEIIDDYFDFSPMELIQSVHSEFDETDDYFTVYEDGDICSFTDLLSTYSPWDREGCINAIVEDEESYGNPDIQILIDKFNEEEE